MNEMPKYVRIKQELLDSMAKDIAAQKIRPGDRVCSETDIIAAYEVSPTTAKRVLNDLVHEGKIYRVQGKGSFLSDWQAAESSERDRPKTIGLIVPGVTLSFFAEIVYGCETSAREHGYRIILGNATDNQKQAEYLQRCLDERVDGLITCIQGRVDSVAGRGNCRFRFANEKLIAQLAESIPTVFIDGMHPDIKAGYVVNDNHAGGVQAVGHLIDLGRRKIVCLSGPQGQYVADGRHAGYRSALESAGIQYDESLVRWGDYFEPDGYRNTKELLATRVQFDALFACDDKVAMGAYNALTEHGLSVPDDVAIAGFANETEPLLRNVMLTTVDQHAEELGTESLRLLVKLMEGEVTRNEQLVSVVGTHLVVRGSTIGSGVSRKTEQTLVSLPGYDREETLTGRGLRGGD